MNVKEKWIATLILDSILTVVSCICMVFMVGFVIDFAYSRLWLLFAGFMCGMVFGNFCVFLIQFILYTKQQKKRNDEES